MPNNIAVKITADVVDLTAKRAILSSELKAATSDLNNFAKTANTAGSKELSTSMLASAEAVSKTRAQIKLLDTEMKSLGSGPGASGLNKAFASLEQGASQAGTARLGAFGAALGAIGPEGIAAGIGLAAMAVSADKAVKAAEWAAQLKRSADTLGMTTTQLQEFDFVLNAMGIDVDKGRESLSGLEKAIGLVMEGAARKQLLAQFVDVMKIKPEDLRGWGTLNEQLPHVLDALAKLDPEERAASFSRLKIDPEVGNSMIQARGHLSDLVDMAHKYGIVVSDDVIDKSAESADKMRAWKAIIDGELRVAFINLAPAIASVAKAAADTIKWINDMAAAVDRFNGVVQTTQVTAESIQAALAPKTKPKELVAPTGHHKKGGDDIVQKWTEQLHEQEVASKDFFSDNLKSELAFWEAKLALTKKGSKDWLEVQSKIFDASKGLAHQAYDELIAEDNDKIEADRDNYARAQADRQKEYADIVAAHGAESAEARNFHRQMEAAERQHEEKMVEAQAKAGERAVKALKENLDSQMSVMETQANAAKELNAANAAKTPILGGVEAARQDMAIDQQVTAQKLANEQMLNAATMTADQNAIVAAEALYGQDVEHYGAAVQKKLDDEQAFHNKVAEMNAQAVAQQQADQLKIQQSWHSVIDPMVQTTGAQIKGLVVGTETWGQALRNVEGEAIQLVVDALEKMVEQWIVGMITGGAATQASAKVGVLAQAGLAGAGGVASMAAAPFPIDLTAPAFGADMFAAALSLGAFAQGTNEVPRDMVAQIHAGERIIPAADNRSLMAAVNDNRSMSSSGDTHNHIDMSSTFHGGGMHPDDVIKAIGSRTSDMARILKGMHRNGQIRLAG